MTEKVSCSILKPKKKGRKKAHSMRKATEGPGYEFITEDEIATCYVSVEESSCSTPSSYSRMAESETSSLDFCQSGDEDRGDMLHSGMVNAPVTGPSFPLGSNRLSDSDLLNYGASIPPALVTSTYDEYCFVSKFTQTLASSRRNYSTLRPESWISKLPYLVATNSLPRPLKYALHAVALLYHAVTRDSRAERPAIQYYLAGIKSYRSVVLGNQAGQSPTTSVSEEDTGSEMSHPADIVAICGPVLFSFYEALQDAGSSAELLHHSVAVEMLRARGPNKCVDGLAHSVMRSMRVKEVRDYKSYAYAKAETVVAIAFHSIMQNRSASFSSPEWLSIPFQKKHRICYDKLIDILLSFTTTLRLPSMNQKGTKLRSSIHRIHDLPTARKNKIEERVRMLQEQLQHWWLEFRDEHCEIIAQNSGISPAVDAAYGAADSPSSVLPLSGPWMLANNETLTSSMVSIYSGIHVILHSVLFIISLSKSPCLIKPGGQSMADIHRATISMYAASVFNAALYLNMVNPFCGDAVRTKFAINIVLQFALEDSQRDEAQRMLSQWKIRGTAPHR
ncbi:hypothetical protein MKX08_002334 [Trichoderma sp. CBMAI-0020]|nr:hypothetical protein MKX08_002334 [Trichoderma sp. CBMAI-0020]